MTQNKIPILIEDKIIRNLGVVRIIRLHMYITESELNIRSEMFKLMIPITVIKDLSYMAQEHEKWLVYHPNLEEVPDGEQYPEYIPTIHNNNDKITITFKKVDGYVKQN